MPAPDALTLARKLLLLAAVGGVGAVGLARLGLSSGARGMRERSEEDPRHWTF